MWAEAITSATPVVTAAAENQGWMAWFQTYSSAIQAMAGIVSAAAAAASVGIAAVLLKQIGLQKKQLKNQDDWNRINASFTYFNDETFQKLSDCLDDKMKAIDVNFRTQGGLNAKVLSRLKKPKEDEDIEARKAIGRLMDFLEAYCIALLSKPPVIDKEIAREMYGSNIIFWYGLFYELIQHDRAAYAKATNGRILWDKLEAVYDEWMKRDESATGSAISQQAPADDNNRPPAVSAA